MEVRLCLYDGLPLKDEADDASRLQHGMKLLACSRITLTLFSAMSISQRNK